MTPDEARLEDPPARPNPDDEDNFPEAAHWRLCIGKNDGPRPVRYGLAAPRGRKSQQ